jgi:hypothetical protein
MLENAFGFLRITRNLEALLGNNNETTLETILDKESQMVE